MGMKIRNQRGFTAVETLIIVLVLVVLGGAGYFVWHAQRTGEKTVNLSGSTSSKPNTKFLTIKEWGVAVPMPANVMTSDIYYKLKADNTAGATDAILGSTKLGALVASCDINNSTGSTPFGWIEKMAPSAYAQAKADATNTGVTNGTLLGGYYYVWQAPRGNCYEISAKGNTKLQSQIKALSSSNNSLVDNFPSDMATVLTKIKTSGNSSSTSSQMSTQKYLTIKEWGVRTSYISSDTLSYTYEDFHNVNNITYSPTKVTDTAIIVSQELKTKYGCNGSGASGVGFFVRYKPSDKQVETTVVNPETYGQLAKAHPNQYKLIGNYVYVHYADQGACSIKENNAGDAATSDAVSARMLGLTLITGLKSIQ
jgi:hypothetical protein